MEGELQRQEEGSRPLLLDLIPHKGEEWLVRDRGGEGGLANGYEVEEEEKLKLRLGLPGGDCWTSKARDKRTNPSPLSLTLFPFKNMSNHSAGAKRGFLDTLQSQPQGYHHHKSGFVHYHQSTGAFEGAKLDQLQQTSLEKKACSKQAPPADRNAAAERNRSPSRTGTAPVVGWPPIRSFRKNLASCSSKPSSAPQSGFMEKKEPVVCTKSLLVKINMDGIPIGRKVDLLACSSYDRLSSAVDELFRGLLKAQREPSDAGNYVCSEGSPVISGLLDGTGEYTLVYEDNEGDRMLVGDVPWDMFVSTVKRLRVLKSSELPSLSLGIAANWRRNEGVKSKN